MKYVKALRPVMGLFSSLMCLAAIHLQAPNFAQENPLRTILLLIAVFCGTTATMVYNDYVDRIHDLKKDKRHAYEHPQQYLALARLLYVTCAACCVFASGNEYFGWLQLGVICLCCVGLFYSATYKIPLLPMIVVGVTSATPSLFALLIPQADRPFLGWVLFVGIVLSICAREILKDIDDAEIDRGYKWTIPSLRGVECGRNVAATILLPGAVILGLVCWESILLTMPISMLISGLVVLYTKRPDVYGKLAIDLGTVYVISALLLTS